jgi:MtN3 and saliva related transmembrane protein
MKKEFIGYAAGVVGGIMMVPQVYKVIKTNSTTDISFMSILLIVLCSLLWIWYGIIIDDFPIILADVIMILEELIILIYKIKHSFWENTVRVVL